MAGGEKLGSLYFDLGIDDTGFESKMKSAMDKYKKLEMNVGVKIDQESAKKAISSTTDALKNSSKVDFSSTITPLVSRLKEARIEIDVLRQLMVETKNTGKKLEIRTNIKDTEKELESLMRQISALNKAQSSLNIKTSPSDLTPSRGIKDEGSLSSMRAYYTQLEKDASNFAKAEAAAAKESIRASKEMESAKRQASNSASRDALNANKGNTELAKEALLQQKIATEVERTALAHKRLETAGSQSQSRINSNSEWTNKTLLSQRQIAMQLSNQFGTMFSIYAVERFIKKLADVRGEFEQQKIALESILQDGQVANKIFEQIKNLSVESPFRFKDLVGYTKQLSAFQIPASELYDTMKRLADVSSGLGVGMDRIVLAFGQVRSASVLRGQELRQFTEAGIPLVQMLADKFSLLEHKTVTTGDVFERISKRMVSFGDVKDIFDDLTSAGGKFYEMQEKQAKGLLGMMTNLQDAIDIALNDIGESNEGILKGAVQLTTNLINNWESVARVVMSAVAAYGAYKAVMLINAALNSNFVAGLALQSARLAMITSEMGAATAAQYALNTAVSLSPWTVAALAIGATVGAIMLLAPAAKSAKKEIDGFNEASAKSEKAASRVNELVKSYEKLSSSTTKSADEHKRLQSVIDEISKQFPSAVTGWSSYGKAIDVNIEKVKRATKAEALLWAQRAQQDASAAKRSADALARQNSIISSSLNKGRLTNYVEGVQGVPDQKLDKDLINRLLDRKSANASEIILYNESIKRNNDIINSYRSIFSDQKQVAEDIEKNWAQWAKNFSSQTKQEGIRDVLNEFFTSENLEGGSEKITKELSDAYERDKVEYKRYLNEKGIIHSAAEKSALKIKMNAERAALDILGGTKDDLKPDKTDYIAIRLENEIKLVKNLYSEYEKLKKTQGADAAKNIISTAPEYASSRNKLSAIGVSVEFSQDKMNEQVSKLIARTQQTKKVKEIGASWASNIDKGFAEKFNETFENIVKTIEQAISDYKPKYDLYEKLLGLTGDSERSSLIAFGNKSSIDLETFMREQYAKIPNAGFYSDAKKPSDDASEEVKKAWNELTEYIQSKKIGKIEYFEQLISESASSSDKIKKIELQRDRDLSDARKTFSNNPDELDRVTLSIKKNSELQINEIRSQLFQLTPLYNEVFKDLGKVAAGNLDALLSKTKGLINLVKTNGEVKKDNDGRTTGYFLKAGTVDPNSGLKIEKDTLISVEKYNDLIERTNAIVNKINENPFKALFNPPKGATSETVEEKAKRISSAIQGISDLVQSVSGEIGNIMDSFGASSESQAALKNITQVASGAGEAGSGVAKLASGDIVGGIKGVVSGIGKVITGLNAIHDAKYEKQIKEYQKQIDVTVKSYDALTDALSRKTEASKLDANAENYNLLQREKNLIEQQKLAEESKKKSDQSKIDDYNKQIEDLAKKQQELAYNTISSVLGGSIGSQADSWAKTLTNAMDTAFQNGTDAAQAWGDSVDNIVRDIAKNFVVNSFLGKQLQNWLEEASADWTNADKSVNQKNIEDDLKGFSTFAKSLEPATEAALKALNSIYGDGTSSSSSTLSSNIKGVTENTADRLASMINAIRQDSAVIRATTSLIRDIMQSYGSRNTEANSYLQKMDANIRQNTLNTTAILSAIQDVTTNGSNGKALKLA